MGRDRRSSLDGVSAAEGLVEMDEHGLIKPNHYMETSLRGLYVCGDCRVGTVRQMVH